MSGLIFPWMEKPSIRFGLLPFIGGLLYASGFPMKGDFTFFLGPFIGMTILLSCFALPSYRYRSFQSEMASVLSFSLGHYLLGFYWIPYTITEFGGVPFPFNYTLGLFFSLVIIPHFLVFALGNAFFKRLKLRPIPLINSSARRNLFYALVFTLLEAIIPQQFPGHLGHPWLVLAPYLGLAPVFGVPGFSFLSYLLILSLLSWFRDRERDGISLAFFAVFVVANIIFPLEPYPHAAEPKLNVRMVQANIGNYMKISSESGDFHTLNKVLETFHSMSLQDREQFKPDLIIWPETAYPRLLSSQMMRTSSLYAPRLVQDTIADTQAELFFGGYDQITHSILPTDFFETEYNSAFHVGLDGVLKEIYHKRVLIPFGESLPFGPFNKYLSQYITNISFFAKGDRYTTFHTKNQTPFISLICYEVLFSGYVRDYLRSIERHPLFAVNLTNDSWYGDTAEPYQHLFLAKWRALEFDLPILRMTNTGITSVIYPDGSESYRLLPFTQGNLDVSLALRDRRGTIYQSLGLFAVINLFIALLLIHATLSRALKWSRNPL
jgi:apolipoprotein N-acyltransferase